MKPQNLGVLIDPRSPNQKEYDYSHEEIFTSSVPTYWGSKAQASEYVGRFPIDNQFGTSSCVAHGKVLVMSIFDWLQKGSSEPFTQLSSMFIYRNRVNFPGEGMVPSSANMQTIKGGAPIYADLPTPTTEAAANALEVDAAMTQAAKQFAAGKWVTVIDPTDMDTLAFVSNSLLLPLNILIYATLAEWSQEVVTILTPGLQASDLLAEVSHCVTVLPNSAYMLNGKRYVIIQDSALFGGFSYRSVSEDFIAARTYEADYMIAMGNQPMIVKPKVLLNFDLTVGSTLAADITALQIALQYMGYFPNVVGGKAFLPTGTYGGITKNAVLKLQNEYPAQILTPAGLTVGTGYCGAGTRAFINKLFA